MGGSYSTLRSNLSRVWDTLFGSEWSEERLSIRKCSGNVREAETVAQTLIPGHLLVWLLPRRSAYMRIGNFCL
ncbi:uncharacterized protein H6S33_012621 [Morchella sextelata]|uniref:uncharacterized protein n=1 Tax=Morchella sextelata TaxID=1174677 RepID=UPI001D03F897|nr:uncharacterized protein H6S33_012621 [Morchella sextelata]KAH0610075.1 hypothetical protein H6S33_012621 [Morchella sextelata]